MLKREASLGVGLAVSALVLGIYWGALPTVAEQRVSEPDDRDLHAAERTAMWTSIGAVAAVSLIAKDPTVFILGGAATIAMSWVNRHANAFNAALGSATIPTSRVVMDDARATTGYVPV